MDQLIFVSLFLTTTFVVILVSTEPQYILKHERAILVKFNASLVKNNTCEFSFKKINRTDTALNVSFTLLEDLMEGDVMMHLYVEKKTAQGDYRYFGAELKAINVCKFFKANAFGIPKNLARYGNLNKQTLCNVKKGYYYLRNYIPDISMFPKYFFFGNFRLCMSVYCQEANLFVLQWYVSIEKPPANW